MNEDTTRTDTSGVITSTPNVTYGYAPPAQPITWAATPEKEKWKVTIGVILRSMAVSVAIWFFVFLVMMVAI